mgnify:FL=1
MDIHQINKKRVYEVKNKFVNTKMLHIQIVREKEIQKHRKKAEAKAKLSDEFVFQKDFSASPLSSWS